MRENTTRNLILAGLLIGVGLFVRFGLLGDWQHFAATELALYAGYAALGAFIILCVYPLRKFFIFLFYPSFRFQYLKNPRQYNEEWTSLREEAARLEINHEGLNREEVLRQLKRFTKSLSIKRYFHWSVEEADGKEGGAFLIQLRKKERPDKLGRFLAWHSWLGLFMGLAVLLHMPLRDLNAWYWIFTIVLYANVFSGIWGLGIYRWIPGRYRRLEKEVPYNKTVFRVNKMVAEMAEIINAGGERLQAPAREYILAPLHVSRVKRLFGFGRLPLSRNLKGGEDEVDTANWPSEDQAAWQKLWDFRGKIDQANDSLRPYRTWQRFLDTGIILHSANSILLAILTVSHLILQWSY